MKFDINNYKGNYVMHCKTKDEAREFLDYLNSVGKKWQDGEAYSKKNIYWHWGKENTCYNFNEGRLADKKYYLSKDFTILEWSDFTTEFTKADLKDGMVVEYANGNRAIVLGDKIVENSGFWRIVDFTNELKMPDEPEYTVNKVYKSKAVTIGDLFNATYLTLIWERKEKPKPVEMTIEEICKALGKEIKIVKG